MNEVRELAERVARGKLLREVDFNTVPVTRIADRHLEAVTVCRRVPVERRPGDVGVAVEEFAGGVAYGNADYVRALHDTAHLADAVSVV